MTGIDFQEARRLADLQLRPTWLPLPQGGQVPPDDQGTFYVAPWGWEDAYAFQVVVGAQEWLEGGDVLMAGTGDQVVLVTKASGRVRVESYLEQADRLDSMTPVGEGHPSDE